MPGSTALAGEHAAVGVEREREVGKVQLEAARRRRRGGRSVEVVTWCIPHGRRR